MYIKLHKIIISGFIIKTFNKKMYQNKKSKISKAIIIFVSFVLISFSLENVISFLLYTEFQLT